MKAGAREKEMNKRGVAREVVRIASCPAFDAYLSAKKWPIAEQKSKAMFTRLGEEMRQRCERDMRQLVLPAVFSQHAREHPSLNQIAKRTQHALDFRLKKMASKVSFRKRLRGESKKQKIADLMKNVAIRLFVSKQYLPGFIIRAATKDEDTDFSRRAALAHVKGVNPLFDDVDLTILLCWDRLYIGFLPGQFVGFAYEETELPGLKKWRDAAAALFIAFVKQDETFYSQAARPTKENPHRRPHHRYKGRRKELDLHPHKRPLITNAAWDRGRDVLNLASEVDRWGWEIHRFNPQAHR